MVLFMTLYGNYTGSFLSSIVLWIAGPLLAAYIILPQLKNILTLPIEYYFYISLAFFALLGLYKVTDMELFTRYLRVIVSNWILMVMVFLAINNQKEWILAWKMVLFATLATAFISFFIDFNSIQDPTLRMTGMGYNSNGLSNYSRLGIISILLLLNTTKPGNFVKLFYTGSLVFLSFIILLTASRGGFGNLLLIFGLYYGMRRLSFLNLILLSIVLFIFGNMFLAFFESFLKDFYLYQRLTKFDTVGEAVEGDTRLGLYTIAWKHFVNNPLLGVGLNQFKIISGGRISHTDILDILVQLGIFAGFLYTGIYVVLFRRIKRIQMYLKSTHRHNLYYILIILFISEMLFGLTNPNWFSQIQMVILSMMIAYTAKIIPMEISLSKQIRRSYE